MFQYCFIFWFLLFVAWKLKASLRINHGEGWGHQLFCFQPLFFYKRFHIHIHHLLLKRRWCSIFYQVFKSRFICQLSYIDMNDSQQLFFHMMEEILVVMLYWWRQLDDRFAPINIALMHRCLIRKEG